jgi:hypothetical protein
MHPHIMDCPEFLLEQLKILASVDDQRTDIFTHRDIERLYPLILKFDFGFHGAVFI